MSRPPHKMTRVADDRGVVCGDWSAHCRPPPIRAHEAPLPSHHIDVRTHPAKPGRSTQPATSSATAIRHGFVRLANGTVAEPDAASRQRFANA